MQDNEMDQSDIELDFQEDDIAYYKSNSIGSFNKNTKNSKKLIYLENGKFQVDKECLELLKSIEEEIIVIVFSGKSQTGKSLIANLLLNNNTFEGVNKNL